MSYGILPYTLWKAEGIIDKEALDLEPQGARRRGRPKKTWKRRVQEGTQEMG